MVRVISEDADSLLMPNPLDRVHSEIAPVILRSFREPFVEVEVLLKVLERAGLGEPKKVL